MSSLGFLFVSVQLMAIMILPILLLAEGSGFLKTLFNPGRVNLGLIFLSNAVATAASFFIFSAIKIIGASTASIFEIAYPFFVVLFFVLLYGQRISGWFILGAILIFIGSSLIILKEQG